MTNIKSSRKHKYFNPNAYVILSTLIIIATILTWIIPSGEYERYVDSVTGRTIINPDSFHYIPENPISLFDMLCAIPRGLYSSSEIIMFIFIVSGTIQILKKTGALDAVLKTMVLKLNGSDTFVLATIILISSLLGAIFGFAQEIMPLIPLGVALALGLGYDRVVGFHIIRTALWVGFAASIFNPFSIGISHELAELPLYSGWKFRSICFVIFYCIELIFIIRYAKKVKKDPGKSILNGYNGKLGDNAFKIDETCEMTFRHIIVMIILCGIFVLMIVGTVNFSWGTMELTALFLGSGLLIGIAGKLKIDVIASEFSKGLSDIAFGAIVVGFARAIVLIMEEGMILDTIVYFLGKCVVSGSESISLVGMLLIQSIINFFIGSSTGQAAATMPLMIPLADTLHVSRQSTVLAYQFGSGITDMIYPAMVYYLPFADIPYDRWVKHIWKLVAYLSAAAVVLLSISGVIGYGPF